MSFKKILSFLLFTLMLMNNALARKKSVNPKFLTQELHYLYKNIEIDPSFHQVHLNGPKHLVYQRYEATGKKTTLTMEEYLKQLLWSQSVFEANTGSDRGYGTAFFIGGNLVLTNKHVAETNNVQRSCGYFNIKLNVPNREIVRCKKVHYCSPKYDFCLIEMRKLDSGEDLSAYLPALKFADTHDVNEIDEVYAIGNAVSYGIQGSKGQGVYRKMDEGIMDFVHHSPTFGGSSGSPLLNESGLVVGINYAGNVLFPSGYRIQESELLDNYAVPADVIIDELKANLPKEIYQQIGTSQASEINVSQIIESLNKLKGMIYSSDNFDSIMKFLKQERTLYALKNTQPYRLKNDDINNYVSNLDINDEVINRLMEIISSGVSNIKQSFVKIFKEEIFFNHYQILKDKNKYNTVWNLCHRQNRHYWVDGCFFENLFRPIFNKAYASFPFTKEQKDQIWNQLVDMAKTSSSRYFAYNDAKMNVYLSELALKEIGPINFLVSCIKSQKSEFFHIYSSNCKEMIRNLLEERGYTQVNSDLESRVYRQFILDKEFENVIQSFADDVTNKNFSCLFSNKSCERKNYRKLIANWEYGPKLSANIVEEIVQILVLYHRR